jgi:hypothetical protein
MTDDLPTRIAVPPGATPPPPAGTTGRTYRAPLFLLRPPADARIGWQPLAPRIATPVSQICTEAQIHEPRYQELCRVQKATPALRRRQWETVFIHAVLEHAGALGPGRRLLAFGEEGLAIAIATQGGTVLATDTADWLRAPPPPAPADKAAEHVAARLFLRGFGASEVFLRRAQVSVDQLKGFDGCWSQAALQTFGAIEAGLDAVETSLQALRPGGVAVHTTDINLDSDDRISDRPDSVVFRRRDIEALMSRLLAAGHRVWPLNLHPGVGDPADVTVAEHADDVPNLRQEIEGQVVTSFGLVVQRSPS